MSASDIPVRGKAAARQLEQDLRELGASSAPGFDQQAAKAGFLAKLERRAAAPELADLSPPHENRWPHKRPLPVRAALLVAAALVLAAASAVALGGGLKWAESPTKSTALARAPATAGRRSAPLGRPLLPDEPAAVPSVAMPAPPRERPAAAPAKDDLVVREVAQMKQIRSLLVSSPAQALALAESGHLAFARGMLYQEREAHAILALARLGQRDAAQQRAARFLKASPDGPLSERVRHAVGVQ